MEVWWLTFTDASVVPLVYEDFMARWKRVRDNLDRSGQAPAYYLAITGEEGERRLHRHVLMVDPPSIKVLREHAKRAGLGYVHINEDSKTKVPLPITPTPRSARDLSSYCARNALSFAIANEKSPGNINPVSHTRPKIDFGALDA